MQDPKAVAAVSRLGSGKGFPLQQQQSAQLGGSPLHRSSPPPHFQHPPLHAYPRPGPTMQYRFAPSNGAMEFMSGPTAAPGSFGAQEELWTLLRPQMTPQASLMMQQQASNMASAALAAEQVACRKNLQKMMGVSPSDIDKYSRIFFPVTFTCFNLMYWIIYMHVSDEVAQDLVMLNQ